MKYGAKSALYEQGTSYLQMLEHAGYDERHCIFEMDDGSIGAAYEISMPALEFADEELLQRRSQQMESFFKRCEANTAVQVIFTTDANVRGDLEAYRNSRTDTSNRVINVAMQMRQLCYENGAINHLFKREEEVFSVRNLRVIITIRYFPKNLKSGIFEGITSQENLLRKRFIEQEEVNKSVLLGMMREAEALFGRMQVRSKRLTADEMIRTLYTLLNPKRAKRIAPPKHNPSKDIREEILFNHPAMMPEYFIFEPEIDPDGKITEGVFSSAITMKTTPAGTYPGMFTRELDGGLSLIDRCKDFTVCYCIYMREAYLEKSDLRKRVKTAETNIAGREANNKAPDYEDRLVADESSSLMADMDFNNSRLVNARVHFIVRGETLEEYRIKKALLLRSFEDLGTEGIPEPEIGAGLFNHCLPLGFDPIHEGKICRMKKMLAKNLSDMLPLYGYSTGTGTPDQLLVNRRGQLVRLSIWDKAPSPHMLICGTSGSGKSFTVATLVTSWLAQQSKVIIFDRDMSYKPLARLVGGETPNCNINKPTINIVKGCLRGLKKNFLNVIMSLMACAGRTSEELSQEEENYLADVCERVYVSKRWEAEYVNDADIQRQKDRYPATNVFIHDKKKLCQVSYQTLDNLVELKDEEQDEENNLEMDIYRLCRISRSMWLEREKQLLEVLKHRDLSAHEDIIKVTVAATAELLEKINAIIRHRGYIDIGEHEQINERKLKSVVEKMNLVQDQGERSRRIHFHNEEQHKELIDAIQKHIPGNLKHEALKGEGGKVTISPELWCDMQFELVRELKAAKVEPEIIFDDYLVEYEEAMDMEAISQALGKTPEVAQGRANIYIYGERERKAIRSILGLRIERENEIGRCILQREVFFSDIGKQLGEDARNESLTERQRTIAETLELKLKEYYGNGAFAKSFDGSHQFDISKKFTVIETKGLEGTGIYKDVYLLSLFNMVYEDFQKPENVGTAKYNLMEEGWSFMDSEKAAKFINDTYRTGRKYGFACGIITQQPEDCLASANGRSIVANSPWKFLLMQDTDMLPYISKQLNLSEIQHHALSGVRMEPGLYAEIYIRSPAVEGIFRIVPDPVMYWINTTNKDDKSLRNHHVNQFKEEGLDTTRAMARAIIVCAKEYPYGTMRPKGDPHDPMVKALDDIVM
ncbi:MAG: TraC family protein [Planctomycetes bacterium]|nr:TraC family protein [Planctomycetota bacterium]